VGASKAKSATKQAEKPARKARGRDKKPRIRRTKVELEAERAQAAAAAGQAEASDRAGEHEQQVLAFLDAREAKEREEALYRRIKREREELKLRQERGELIERTEVERMLAQRVTVLKRRLLALADQLPPQLEGLEPRQMKAIIKQRVEDMILEYAGQRAPRRGSRKGAA